MDIAEVHEIIDFLSDRERGEYFDPNDIDRALHVFQLREIQKYFGDDRAIQQGNMNLIYRQMQHIDDAVSQFKSEQSLAITANTEASQTLYPDQGYLYLTGVYFVPTDTTKRPQEVTVVSRQEYINRVNSAIFKDLPCACLNNGALLVQAPQAGSAKINLIDVPASPDLDTPTDLDWNETKTIDIIYGAIQLLGLNASQEDVMSFAIGKSNPQT